MEITYTSHQKDILKLLLNDNLIMFTRNSYHVVSELYGLGMEFNELTFNKLLSTGVIERKEKRDNKIFYRISEKGKKLFDK